MTDSNSETNVDPHLRRAADSIERAYRISEIIMSENYDNLPEGIAAVDAAFAASASIVEELEPDVKRGSLWRVMGRIADHEKLTKLKEDTEAMGLPVDAIVERITTMQTGEDKDEKLVAGFIVVSAMMRRLRKQADDSPVVMAPKADIEATAEDKTLPVISIKYGMDEKSGMPAIYIGNRRVKLATKEIGLKHAAEKFMALAVMSDLIEGDSLTANELWTRMYTKVLGEEVAPSFDWATMRNVKKFLTNLTYRRQRMFLHNERRGLASAYLMNPELKFDVVIDAETEQKIQEFARELHELGRRTETPAGLGVSLEKAPKKTKELETLILIPEDETAPSDLPTEPEEPSLEDVEAARFEKFKRILPNVLELHSFLHKIQSVTPAFIRTRSIPETSMLNSAFELVDEMLEFIEYGYDEGDIQKIDSDISLDVLRSEVTEKLIKLTENDEMLNDLLEHDIEKVFSTLYGGELGTMGVGLIEIIIDMDDEEKSQLRELITFDPGLRIVTDQGSYSSGVQIIEVTPDLPEPLDFPSYIFGDDDFDVNTAHLIPGAFGPVIQSAEETVPNALAEDLREERIEHIPEQPKPEPTPTESTEEVAETKTKAQIEEAHVRRFVGQAANKLLEEGIKPGDTVSTRQLEAIFGISVPNVVNASENNLISETNKLEVEFKDVIMLLLAKDNDPIIKRLLTVPRMRKLIKTTAKSTEAAIAKRLAEEAAKRAQSQR